MEGKDKGHIDSIKIDHKAGSVDNRMVDPGLFPFDAFEYDDPSTTTAPKLMLKDPWSWLIGSGAAGKIYEQALAPNVGYSFDIWIDTDTNTRHIHNRDIISTRGGAGSSITTFDSDIGGAPANNTSWLNTYGNIPSYAGWIESFYTGTTAIDGGRIKTDTLKSANFVTGVSGSKFDLANGYIETGSGVFRGNLSAAGGTFSGNVEIGADDANRQLSLGSKGLLVKDANGVIIHDLPDAVIQSGSRYCGHDYWYQDLATYKIYDSTTAAFNIWTQVTCIVDSNTNVKKGIFKVYFFGQGLTSYGAITMILYLRPYGSSWAASIASNTPSGGVIATFSSSIVNRVEQFFYLECPIGNNNKIEFQYEIYPSSSSYRIAIMQLGISI